MNEPTTSTDDWYTAKEAEEIIGCSRRQLDRLVKNTEISAFMRAGRKRYRPEDVDNLELVPEESTGPEATKVLDQTQKHLETVMRHYDKMVGNMSAPLELLLEAWKTEMSGMRLRVKELEGVHMEVIRQREELATDHSMRALVEAEHSANQKRKDEAWETFKTKLLPRLTGSSDMEKFLASFKPEQIQALIEGDFLNSEQLSVIQRLRGNASNGASTTTPDAAPKEGTN